MDCCLIESLFFYENLKMADPDYYRIFGLDDHGTEEITEPNDDEPILKRAKLETDDHPASANVGDVSEFHKALDLMGVGFHEPANVFSSASTTKSEATTTTPSVKKIPNEILGEESSLDVSSEILHEPSKNVSDSELDELFAVGQKFQSKNQTAGSSQLDTSTVSSVDQPVIVRSDSMTNSVEEDRLKMQ